MRESFKRGDLINLKNVEIAKDEKKREVGIIIDVLFNSSTNRDWDLFLVLMPDGKIHEKTGRQIYR
jgi:hypothetical protein